VVIPWFKNRREVYLEFYRYWSSPEFKVKSEKKRLKLGIDPKHRYDANGHVHKSQRMVRFHGSSVIYLYVVMRLNLNCRLSGVAL
jgi:hypothetical protein